MIANNTLPCQRLAMKKILVFVLLLFPGLSFTAPQLAVLETILASGIDPTVSHLLTSKIEEEFVNSGKYQVLDRSNVEQVLTEKEFQLSSGLVRNEEVRQAGEYLGADFVVIANVSRIGQTYVITAKMIDVESGAIAAQASSEQQGKIDVLLNLAQNVGEELAWADFGDAAIAEKPKQEPEPEPEKEPEKEQEKEVVRAEPKPKPVKKVGDKNIIVGVKGGMNLSWITGDRYHFYFTDDYVTDPDESPYEKYGIVAGVYIVSSIADFLAVQVEVLYAQKGYEYYLGQDWYYDGQWWDMGGVTNAWNYNYLEVPVLIKAGMPGAFGLYAVVGASFSMWLNGTIQNMYDDPDWQKWYDDSGLNDTDIYNLFEDAGYSINDYDLGLVVGVGVDIALGTTILNVEARYTHGVLEVVDDPLNPYTNSALSITGGAGFAF